MINANLLATGNFGLEKESLRVLDGGYLTLTTHESKLGAKTQFITTDFSESQVEMVTPPCCSIDAAYEYLKKLDLQVTSDIGDELLWPQSNPCILPKTEDIPVALSDTEKKHYREYLAEKYGKHRGVLSGIHFNVSFSDELLTAFRLEDGREDLSQGDYNDKLYLKINKYLLKYRWLFIYLTGASPVFHETYDPKWVGRSRVDEHGDCYLEEMQSFRNSFFGYRNKDFLYMNYESFDEYTTSLDKHIENGLLKKRTEFYTLVRARKSSDHINYIELRFLDLNPFDTFGINQEDLQLIHLFFIYFSRQEDFEYTELMQESAEYNQEMVARYNGDIFLMDDDLERVRMDESAEALLRNLEVYLDDVSFLAYDYKKIIMNAREKINDQSLTYSNRIYASIKKSDYISFHLNQALELKNKKLEMLQEQKDIEKTEFFELKTNLFI